MLSDNNLFVMLYRELLKLVLSVHEHNRDNRKNTADRISLEETTSHGCIDYQTASRKGQRSSACNRWLCFVLLFEVGVTFITEGNVQLL